jgi:hypothetical protein
MKTTQSLLATITSPAVVWMLSFLALALWKLFEPHAKEPAKILLLMVVLALSPSVMIMTAENRAFPLKFDYFLLLIDRSLGVTAFWVARLLTAGERSLLLAIYQSLLAAMIVWYAVNLKRRNGRPGTLLLAYLVSYVAGASLYLIVPACGPRHAFGSAFPMGNPDVRLVTIPLDFWPNAIPSLHVATALLFIFFAGKSRVLRFLAWAYLVGTVLATLAFEHYVIDLVVAVPFACFATRLAGGEIRSACTNLVVVLAWLLAIRFETPALLLYPVLLRVFALGTVTLAGFGMLGSRQPVEKTVLQTASMEVSG